MTTFTVETIDPQPAASIAAEVPMHELRNVFDRAFPEVARVAQAQGVAIVGPPFGFYPRPPGETVAVVVGFPVATPVAADGDVEPFELPGGKVVTGTHVGAYDALGQSYEELVNWARAEGLALGQGVWESYVSDPSGVTDPSTLQTQLVWPLA